MAGGPARVNPDLKARQREAFASAGESAACVSWTDFVTECALVAQYWQN